MSSEPTTVDKLRALPWSIASNAMQAIYLQLTFFGSVFVLFLNTLGLDKNQIGFLLSLLPFTGVISVALAPAIARFGYKRTWLTFFGTRTAITALLLLTPLVVARLGVSAAMSFMTVVVLIYALIRTVGVTAGFPWIQEYVPNSVRGKYTAGNNFFSTFAGLLAILLASAVLERSAALNSYMILLAVGVIAGAVSVLLAVPVPGGAPSRERTPRRNLGDALRDPHMLRYLGGVALFTLATVPLASFLPLYMQTEIGLPAGQVVLLQMGVMAGSLVSSYFWGWAADRYGGRPVTLYGLAFRALIPLCWMMLPGDPARALPPALAIAAFQGFADVGWQVGATRLLYVSIVPPAKRNDYMALYWAWLGLAGGFGQLAGGWLLTAGSRVSGSWGAFTFNTYTPLFTLAILLPLLAILAMRRIEDDSTVGMGGFAGIFLRGNPFLALEAVVRFHLAKDEDAAVRMTERLGTSKSPLTVEELLHALDDPRINVRMEAIIAVARHGPDPRLIEALAEALAGPEPALSSIAAWALGRTADPQAIAPLREAMLTNRYRSVQAHSIRALAVLDDANSIPYWLDHLALELDMGMQLAYASALGRMQVIEATPRLLEVLAISPSRSSRREMALAVARLVGDENHFVSLLRHVDQEPGTALAQAALAVHRRLPADGGAAVQAAEALDRCAQTLAHDDLEVGLQQLAAAILQLPSAGQPAHFSAILLDTAQQMMQFGPQRMEYPALALHAMTAGLTDAQGRPRDTRDLKTPEPQS